MKRHRNSLSAKLTFYILIVTSLVFVGSFCYFYSEAKRAETEEVFSHANDDIQHTSRSIELVLNQIECTVLNAVTLFNGELSKPEFHFDVLEAMVISHPSVWGASIAFEPYYYPQYGKYYFPYVCHDADTLAKNCFTDSTYNYHTMDWYRNTIALDQDNWCEPYFDQGAGNQLMTTYCYPLKDEFNVIFAVVTADLRLAEITYWVESLKPVHSSYSFMISKEGFYLSHPKGERIMVENIFENNKEIPDGVARDMLMGKNGAQYFNDNDIPSYIFYAPIPAAGWSIGSIVTHDEIFEGLNKMSVKVIYGALLGILVLILVLLMVIRKTLVPLAFFSRSAKFIATGNFEVKLPVIASNDELGELSRAFVYMQTSLKAHLAEVEKVTTVRQQIVSELQIARSIQLGMVPHQFPPFPDRDDLDLYAIIQPAKEVGGDLYDYFIHDNCLYYYWRRRRKRCSGRIDDGGDAYVISLLVLFMWCRLKKNRREYEPLLFRE